MVSLIRKTGPSLIMKVISLDNGKNSTGVARGSNFSESGSSENLLGERVPPVVNGTAGGVDGIQKEKKPPVPPSRAPTTSLSRPKSVRPLIAGESSTWLWRENYAL